MRRMLRRCNTAIGRGANGTICYAPGIAVELQLQLDEWYNYLPEVIRFQLDFATTTFEVPLDECPLRNFLRVQYYCCKVAIYWPAIASDRSYSRKLHRGGRLLLRDATSQNDPRFQNYGPLAEDFMSLREISALVQDVYE